MTQQVFRCHKCNKRLPVDDVDGEIKAVVHCHYCRAPNRLEMGPPPKFRTQIEVKA